MSFASATSPLSSRIDLAHEPDFVLHGLQVRPSALLVEAGGRQERLERRIMQVLVALAQSGGATVSREELAERCWGGRVVGEDALQRCIRRLRGLANLPGGPHFEIQTVPRIGYRLCVEACVDTAENPGARAPVAGQTGWTKRLSRGWPLAGALALVLAIVVGVATWRLLDGRLTGPPSIAVLPFQDLSAGRDKGYFAEGVSEEIRDALAGEHALRVIGRTSSAMFKDRPDLRAMRYALKVSHVLEGSVQSDGALVRVNVRLVRSSDGAEVWTERYQKPLANIFAIQDEIGASVARRLRGALTPHGFAEVGQPANVRAYDLYLAGRTQLRQRDLASLEGSRVLFNRALQADSNYAPAYAALAEATYLLGGFPGPNQTVDMAQSARAAEPFARTAIRLAPNQADGYAALGVIQLADPHPAAALATLQRAVRLAPARADVRIWLSHAYNGQGRWDEAFRLVREAYEMEPLWDIGVINYLRRLLERDRFAEAEQLVQRQAVLLRSPERTAALRGVVAFAHGDLAQAVRLAEAAHARRPHDIAVNTLLAYSYAPLGLRDRAAAVLPATSRLERVVLAGHVAEAAKLVEAMGPQVWTDPFGAEAAAEILASQGRWSELSALYDGRFRTSEAFCRQGAALVIPPVTVSMMPMTPVMALALQRSGRGAEAAAILRCGEAQAERQLNSSVLPATAWLYRAELASVGGDRARALDSLDRALALGWRGYALLSPDLADQPAFAPLKNEPRFQAARTRVLSELARQRATLDQGGRRPA